MTSTCHKYLPQYPNFHMIINQHEILQQNGQYEYAIAREHFGVAGSYRLIKNYTENEEQQL